MQAFEGLLWASWCCINVQYSKDSVQKWGGKKNKSRNTEEDVKNRNLRRISELVKEFKQCCEGNGWKMKA